MLFENQKQLEVEFTESPSIKQLIEELRSKHLKDKEEMFVLNGSVRPGIIVLINDTDWELEGELEYQCQHNDTIAFISTLHGG